MSCQVVEIFRQYPPFEKFIISFILRIRKDLQIKLNELGITKGNISSAVTRQNN